MATAIETKQRMRAIHEMTVKYKRGQNQSWHNIARERKYHVKVGFEKYKV